MKYPESLAPSEFGKLLQYEDWIKLHKSWLFSILDNLHILSSGWHSELSTTILERCFLPILSREEKMALRDRLASWWRLAWQKNLWAYQSRFTAFGEVESDTVKWDKEIGVARKWPGPQEEKIVKAMTAEERETWRVANITTMALSAKWTGLISLHITERFFAFESLAKSLCAARCIDFCYKAIDPNSIIQHQEVWKTLKRLGADRKNNNTCRLCRLATDCHVVEEASLFAQSYIALIHMRMLKDYREELLFNTKVQEYFAGPLFDLMGELLFLIEEYNDMVLGKFLSRPLSFREGIKFLDEQLCYKRKVEKK